jgi:hypothetical protein
VGDKSRGRFRMLLLVVGGRVGDNSFGTPVGVFFRGGEGSLVGILGGGGRRVFLWGWEDSDRFSDFEERGCWTGSSTAFLGVPVVPLAGGCGGGGFGGKEISLGLMSLLSIES